MSLIRLRYFCFALLLLSLVSNIRSEEKKDTKQILKLGWENDVFLFSDREYTNGIKLEYGIYEKTYAPSALILLAIESLLPALKNKTQEYSSVSLNQSLYTPINLYASDASYGERPYSALALLANTASYTWERSAFSVETAIGQMGPAMQGKYFQERIHLLTNSPIPQGWDSQIPNRTLYQMNADWKYFFNPNVGIQSTVKLGNLDTSFSFGPVFRFGWIHSPVSAGMNIQDQSPSYQTLETESYFYFKPSIKEQSINASLGNREKNELTALVSPNDSSSLFFNNGRTMFIGEPLYNSLLDENSSFTLARFLIYERSLSPDMPFGMRFLIFNSIFNGASVPGNGLKLMILETILNNKLDTTKYPGLEYFLYDTLFRDQTTGISVYSKFLAVTYLYSNGISQPEANLIAAIILYNDQNSNRSYHVDVKRFQGRISTGYVFQNPGWFFQMGLEISSLEYVTSEGVSSYHRYTSFQLGKKF
jgi:hypothetical protein